MAESSANLYKKSLDKAFSEVGLNPGTMADHAKYSQGMKEDKSEDTPMIRRSISKLLHSKKKETKEQENQFSEEWSEKYKKSIDCSHPKGFSQKAHCQGRKKKQTNEGEDLNLSKDNKEMVNGIADIINQVKDEKNKRQIVQNMIKQFKKENIKVDTNEFLKMCKLDGVKKIENKEATGSGSSGAFVGPVFGGDDEFWERSRSENPKLKESEIEKVEAKEATGSGSVGGYSSPSMWAKSTKKKDWGPSRKTQIPGGGFVKIKKKCTKFPYCNQGDINNIKISKNESVKEAIKNVSKKTGVSESIIKTILEREYEKINKRHK